MAKKTAARLGLFIQPERNGGFFHIHCYPVWIGPTPYELARIDAGDSLSVPSDRIRNISSYSDEGTYNGVWLADFNVSCQGNDHPFKGEERRLYAFGVIYKVSRIETARDATRIASSLTTIEKRLEKMHQVEGHVESYAQYANRVARAIGASCFVVPGKNNRHSSAYDDGEFWTRNLADGMFHIGHLEDKWKDEQKALTA